MTYNYTLSDKEVEKIISILEDNKDEAADQIRAALVKQFLRWKEWEIKDFSRQSVFTGI